MRADAKLAFAMAMGLAAYHRPHIEIAGGYPSGSMYQWRDRGNRAVSVAQMKRDAKKRKNIRKRKK